MSQRAATLFRRSSAHRWAFACALLIAACTTAETDAEIVIVVDTDFAVPDELDAVDFYVKRVGASAADAQTLPVRLGGKLGRKLPLRLGIAPDGKVKSAVDIVVTGYVGNPRTEVIRRKASLRFQAGKVLLLRMDLVKSCEPKYLGCEEKQQTCDPRGCVPVDDVEVLPWNGDDDQGSPLDETSPAGDGDADQPVQLALGAHHSCVMTARGRVFCWGRGGEGQLGDGQADHGQKCGPTGVDDCSPTPVEVTGLPAVRQITAGRRTTCAVHERRTGELGNVSCWGEMPTGALLAPGPLQFEGRRIDEAEEVRIGDGHACVRRTDALPVCWGEPFHGELGNGATVFAGNDPVLASTLEGVAPADLKQLALGDRSSCALLHNGSVLCWGSNDFGQLGQALTTTHQLTPVPVDGLSGVDSLSVGSTHLCGVVPAEGIYCLGNDTFGQLGAARQGDTSCGQFGSCSPAPLLVAQEQIAGEFVEVAAGGRFTCARVADGRVACWGYNDLGQLGEQAVDNSTTATPVLAIEEETLTIAAGADHACAIMADGHAVVCWGDNALGQLGVSSADIPKSAAPVTVPLEL